MKLTKKQLTYLVESEVKKYLKNYKKNSTRIMKINEDDDEYSTSLAEELINIFKPYKELLNLGYWDLSTDNTIDYDELNDYIYNEDIDELDSILEVSKNIVLSFDTEGNDIIEQLDNLCDNYNYEHAIGEVDIPIIKNDMNYRVYIPIQQIDKALQIFLKELDKLY